jgi:hypothetical protein
LKRQRLTPRVRLAALFVPTAIALAACGGSDDSSSGAAPAPGPGATPLSISGTAAVGAPLAGGTVDTQCSVGDGTATTAADGSYSLQIPDGRLPCTLRVTSADGAKVLHSAAAGSGNSARANLTPATELAMAQLWGRSPAAAHVGFDAAAVVALTPAALQTAASATTTLLATAGVTISGNPVSGALAIGDANDRALEVLSANLAGSGTTLASVVAIVAAQASGTAPPAGTPTLPTSQLLAGAAPNCKALRSGKYRIVFAGPDNITEVFTLDAPTLKVTNADGEVDTLVANGDCRYANPADGSEVAVTSAGIGVVRSQEGPAGSYLLGLVFPEQVHPVSITQGDWNLIGLGDTESDSGQGTVRLFTGAISFNAEGRSIGTTVFCANVRDCENEAALPEEVHTVNAAGGFDFDGGRNFVYKLATGQKLLVALGSDGAFILATPKVPAGVPPLGVLRRSVDFTLTPAFTANVPSTISENTPRSFDAAAGIYTRDAVIAGTNGVTVPQRIELNRFLPGFSHRIPETVTDSAGGQRNVGEWVVLPLPGMGFSPVAILGNNTLVLSVLQPAP